MWAGAGGERGNYLDGTGQHCHLAVWQNTHNIDASAQAADMCKIVGHSIWSTQKGPSIRSVVGSGLHWQPWSCAGPTCNGCACACLPISAAPTALLLLPRLRGGGQTTLARQDGGHLQHMGSQPWFINLERLALQTTSHLL
jgi:hypothetical protein